MKKGRANRQKGFSLIELLIVMVIMGLLAALVGPRPSRAAAACPHRPSVRFSNSV